MPQIITKGKAIAGQYSLLSGVMWISGTGAPSDGVTGAGVAEKGSIYARTSNGAQYYNTGTKASPTWTLQGTVAPGSVGASELDASAVGSAAMDATLLQYAEVSISSADIVSTSAGKLSHAQGQILVAAPGAGKVMELVSATLIYDYAGAGYGGGGNLTINWEAGGAALTGLVSAANSLGAGSDKVVTFYPLAVTATPMVVNAGFNLVSSSVPWTLGSATGVARVKVVYRVHTTGL